LIDLVQRRSQIATSEAHALVLALISKLSGRESQSDLDENIELLSLDTRLLMTKLGYKEIQL
jgi:hypothetical protein